MRELVTLQHPDNPDRAVTVAWLDGVIGPGGFFDTLSGEQLDIDDVKKFVKGLRRSADNLENELNNWLASQSGSEL